MPTAEVAQKHGLGGRYLNDAIYDKYRNDAARHVDGFIADKNFPIGYFRYLIFAVLNEISRYREHMVATLFHEPCTMFVWTRFNDAMPMPLSIVDDDKHADDDAGDFTL